jgi:hypothetical protein
VRAQTAIFINKTVSKKCGNSNIFCLEGSLVSRKQLGKAGCAALWLIFSSNEVCQRIGRKDFIQAAYRKLRRFVAFLYLAAQNFKNSKSKLKSTYKTYVS